MNVIKGFFVGLIVVAFLSIFFFWGVHMYKTQKEIERLQQNIEYLNCVREGRCRD